jgi:hypothetical protein
MEKMIKSKIMSFGIIAILIVSGIFIFIPQASGHSNVQKATQDVNAGSHIPLLRNPYYSATNPAFQKTFFSYNTSSGNGYVQHYYKNLSLGNYYYNGSSVNEVYIPSLVFSMTAPSLSSWTASTLYFYVNLTIGSAFKSVTINIPLSDSYLYGDWYVNFTPFASELNSLSFGVYPVYLNFSLWNTVNNEFYNINFHTDNFYYDGLTYNLLIDTSAGSLNTTNSYSPVDFIVTNVGHHLVHISVQTANAPAISSINYFYAYINNTEYYYTSNSAYINEHPLPLLWLNDTGQGIIQEFIYTNYSYNFEIMVYASEYNDFVYTGLITLNLSLTSAFSAVYSNYGSPSITIDTNAPNVYNATISFVNIGAGNMYGFDNIYHNGFYVTKSFVGSGNVIGNVSTGGILGFPSGQYLLTLTDNGKTYTDSFSFSLTALGVGQSPTYTVTFDIPTASYNSYSIYFNSTNHLKSWYVNIYQNNNLVYGSGTTFGNVTASLPNGSYSYVAFVPSGILITNQSESFSVNGHLKAFKFTMRYGYPFTFYESGLPVGTEWYLNISNGDSNHTTGSSLNFTLSNGTFNYSTYAYGYSSQGGQISFPNSQDSITLIFTTVYNKFVFVQDTLPLNHLWFVNFTNGMFFSSLTTNITANLPAGNYSFFTYSNGFTQIKGNISVPEENYKVLDFSSPIQNEMDTFYFFIIGVQAGFPISMYINGSEYTTYNGTFIITLPVYNTTHSYNVFFVNNSIYATNFAPLELNNKSPHIYYVTYINISPNQTNFFAEYGYYIYLIMFVLALGLVGLAIRFAGRRE